MVSATFKGLWHYFAEIKGLLLKFGIGLGAGSALEMVLSFLVLVLATLNFLKGPVFVIGLVLWQAKWKPAARPEVRDASQQIAQGTAFVAGMVTVFDWTSWELSLPKLVSGILLGFVFIKLYQTLHARLQTGDLG